MKRLKALDAGFLYAETAWQPMHIGSLQILELPCGGRDRFFADMKQMIRSRSAALPYLTHRIQNAPLQFAHPSWVACEVDYDAHIERIEMRSPGDIAKLERIVAELHARPLDRTRPLWKIYYIEGLNDGRAAYFNVVHHACLDGLAGQAAVDVLTDACPGAANANVPPIPAANTSDASRADVVARWFGAGAESIAEGARRIDTLARLGKRLIARSTSRVATPLLAPSTPINRAIGSERSYAVLRVSLVDVKAIGKAHGASINDVYLTLCGTALRAYLLRHGALPSAPLIAGVPVSVRRPGDRSMNTQATMMRVTLETQIEDPVARLAAVHAAAGDARPLAEELNALMPSNPSFPGAPWFGKAAAQLWEITRAADFMTPLINLVISNVPGPRAIRYSNGARMLTHFPVSIPAHGAGINITAQSYVDHFDIGITACAATVPDLTDFRDDLLRAYIDLRTRVLNRRVDVRRLLLSEPHAAIERRCLPTDLMVA